MRQSTQNHNKGFTLIEVIITIVMTAILGVMMFSYANMSYTKSSLSLTQTTKTFARQKIMENIFADYNKTRPAWQASYGYVLGDEVFPAATSTQNGHYYLCTKSGTSSSLEPTWPTVIGATVTDGGVIWREGLQTKIGAEGATCNSGATTCIYGQYTVQYNHFIKFVGSTETPIVSGDPQNILKVTIKNDLGETLSILLTH
jgi:prepilin-type N-terminal cleavage/methylation domain-containing protein